MPRHLLDESRIHPSVRATVADHHRHMVDRVEAEIAKHPVLVVGMALNPMPKKARAALDAAGMLVGGATDVQALIASGELKKMLA